MTVSFTLDGHPVEVGDDSLSLLDAVRGQLGVRCVKDGCSPQGQCGCCTVLVGGEPRVACVTPVRRVAGREVTTVDGLDPTRRDAWAAAFDACGASQCGFCTPGIIVRLESLAVRRGAQADHSAVENALLAHLCRCTGWQPMLDAWDQMAGEGAPSSRPSRPSRLSRPRDRAGAERRALLEGGVAQRVGSEVALGRGGFADDEAPADALVAVTDGRGGWAVGETLAEARATAGKVQGRHTTGPLRHPLSPPPGRWDLTLATTWVEPAYLETDASWCRPGGQPVGPLANGGAFGAKTSSPLPGVARDLADRHGRAVRVLWSREDVVRYGPKRPPLGAGIDREAGRVAVRVARTLGVAEALRAGFGPDADLSVEEVEVAGPPTSLALRAAGWAEGVVLAAGLAGATTTGEVVAPSGGRARAVVSPAGGLTVWVDGGDPLDEVVLRSYVVGAAHMALGWVTSEAITTDADGTPLDLTIRSFGVLRAVDTPPIEVLIEHSTQPPVNVSDAAFAAVAAAVWAAEGFPPSWPTGVRLR